MSLNLRKRRSTTYEKFRPSLLHRICNLEIRSVRRIKRAIKLSLLYGVPISSTFSIWNLCAYRDEKRVFTTMSSRLLGRRLSFLFLFLFFFELILDFQRAIPLFRWDCRSARFV